VSFKRIFKYIINFVDTFKKRKEHVSLGLCLDKSGNGFLDNTLYEAKILESRNTTLDECANIARNKENGCTHTFYHHSKDHTCACGVIGKICPSFPNGEWTEYFDHSGIISTS
jgi:hypothetical protein